jgi:DNA adenine methylase
VLDLRIDHGPQRIVLQVRQLRHDVGLRVAERERVRPLLKWAGGKRQLLPQLRRFVPPAFGRYHEPFLGSGALFFDLWKRGALRHGARLTDSNVDLIGCYTAVRANVEAVITALQRLAAARQQAPADHYYRVRDRLFNPARTALHRPGQAEYSPDLAAMFLYLNRTGFNGLFRLNSRGAFNVPAGRYANPRICDPANLRRVAEALSTPGVRLAHAGYESVLGAARDGDFVYFDPPYAPISATARFTSYTANGFSDADHCRLQRVVVQLAERRCRVVLSNSAAPIVSDLYESDRRVHAAGLRVHKVPARRAINSNPARRGDVLEYVVSNVPPHA